jgi:hypothetical protein
MRDWIGFSCERVRDDRLDVSSPRTSNLTKETALGTWLRENPTHASDGPKLGRLLILFGGIPRGKRAESFRPICHEH